MVGGNPRHDAYGFRYWNNPGAFAQYVTTGPLGRFQGFLAGIWWASFVMTGPEYVSMLAGETSNPTKNLKRAFRNIYWRYGIMFVGSALAVGIVVPYNDLILNCTLNGAPYSDSETCPDSTGSSAGAASSPYVIAMGHLGITVLPHIVNALLVTSIFSAGNAEVYTSSRTLYGLALDGHAPHFLTKCTKRGVPIYCLCISMLFPLLSFLSVNNGPAQVITWLANLTQASQVLDYVFMGIIYLCFYRGLKAQGYSRDDLPYKGWLQPFCGVYGIISMIIVVIGYGYTVFLPGGWWDVGTFSYYTMIFFCIVAFIGWKIVKRTKFVKPQDIDLVWERPAIAAHEALCEDTIVTSTQVIKNIFGKVAKMG